MRFDSKYQQLELLEVYIQPGELKKRITYVLKETAIGSLKLTYSNMNQLMGPTFPPRILGNGVLLTYEGVSYVFEYSDKFKDGVMELPQDQLLTLDNSLVKINLQLDNE